MGLEILIKLSVVKWVCGHNHRAVWCVVPPTIMMSSTTDNELGAETLPRGRHHLERKVRGGTAPDLQPAHQLGVVPDEEPGQPPHHHRLPHPLLALPPCETVMAEAGFAPWKVMQGEGHIVNFIKH